MTLKYMLYLNTFFKTCGYSIRLGIWRSLMGFHNHTHQIRTVCRTPLDGWSHRRRDLYLTTHNTYKIQTSMSPAGFEPVNTAREQPQTHALDRAATRTAWLLLCYKIFEIVLSGGFLVRNVWEHSTSSVLLYCVKWFWSRANVNNSGAHISVRL